MGQNFHFMVAIKYIYNFPFDYLICQINFTLNGEKGKRKKKELPENKNNHIEKKT